jgi:nitroreductase
VVNTANFELRYGKTADVDPVVAPFLSHRSVRRYTDQAISGELEISLMAAAQCASTSSNLQLWSAVKVTRGEARDQVNALCGNQRQVQNAPLFFAFLADHYRLAQLADETKANLDYAEFFTMACIDAALAAERMVCAAEAAGLGACYIGGLRNHPEEIRRLLNLPDGVFGVFGLCLGYPDPAHPAAVKPRLSADCVFFTDTYDQEKGIGDYDERMAAFYADQAMNAGTWSEHSAKRLGIDALGSRITQLDDLHRTGMIRR